MDKDRRSQLIDTIHYVLATATTPLTSVQVAQHPDMVAINAGVDNTSRLLWQLVKAKKKPFAIARIPYHGPGAPQWEYYDPTRLAPLIAKALVEPTEDEPEADSGNQELALNPMDFTDEGEFRGFDLDHPVATTDSILSEGGQSIKPDHSKPQGEPQSVRIDLPGIAITITYAATEAA